MSDESAARVGNVARGANAVGADEGAQAYAPVSGHIVAAALAAILLLTAAIPLADALRGEVQARFAPAALPLALVAANQEQMAAELAMHLLCPGNAARTALSYAAVNLRDYAQFSLVDRLSIGLTSTTTLLFLANCPMLVLFCAFMTCTALARRRGALSLLAALPLSIPLLDAALSRVSTAASALGPLWTHKAYVLQLGPERIGEPGSLAVMAALVTLLGLMALSIYVSLGNRRASLCAVFAFALGFASRMAVSLSPTVVESGERTMLPFYAAMMLCALLCAKDCPRDGSRRWPLVAACAVAFALAAMNVASSFRFAA